MSLRFNIVLYVLAAAVLPFAVGLLAMAGSWSMARPADSRDEELAQATAQLVARELTNTRRVFALGAEAFDLPSLPAEETQGVLRLLYKQDDDVDITVLLDAEDHPVVPPVFLRAEQLSPGSDVARHLPVEDADLERFLKYLPTDAAREKGQAVSDVFVDQRRNVALLAVALAVPAGEGKRPWLLCFERSLRKVQQALAIGMAQPDHSAFVVDAGGRAVAHPDGRRFLNRELLSTHPLVAQFLEGHRAGNARWGEGDHPMAGAFQQLDFLDWAVVVERRLDPLHSAAGGVPGWAWGAWLVVALLILFTGLLLEGKVRRVGGEMQALKDAAERKTEELRKVQASVLESRKLDAIGDLGAGVAHEFNNPLGGILGLTQLLLRKKKENDPDAQFLKRIETEAKRCREITENLLRFSEQQDADHREPLHLDRVLEMTVDLLRAKFEAQRIRIERAFAPNLPRVWGNEGYLRRAFLNVLLNSETAMPDGGKVTLSTAQEEGWVLARVADTGKGIAKENLPRVFEPFFTTKDNWKGAGLGLSVVYQIVQEHGGQVSVASEEGRGTVVTFRFPPQEKVAPRAGAPVPLA